MHAVSVNFVLRRLLGLAGRHIAVRLFGCLYVVVRLCVSESVRLSVSPFNVSAKCMDALQYETRHNYSLVSK